MWCEWPRLFRYAPGADASQPILAGTFTEIEIYYTGYYKASMRFTGTDV